MGSGYPSGTVTFLFTDIEGSTAGWDRHGTAMESAQVRHDEILRSAIGGANGYVFSTAGDGMAAAFGTASAAMDAAVSAQRALAVERWPDDLRLRVRMGVHTGVAVEHDGDYFGTEVIRAARLMGLVGGGCLVCSGATASLVTETLPEEYELTSLGTTRLKGLSAPEEVFALIGPGLDEPGGLVPVSVVFGRGVPRPLTRLMGRDRELEELSAHSERPGLVTLTGPGGVGKTRVALELVGREASRGSGVVLLAGVQNGDAVADVAATALGLTPVGATRPDVMIADLVGDSPWLVLLDNCEHVLQPVRDLVTGLLDRCPRLTVLATSRERLGLPAERATASALSTCRPSRATWRTSSGPRLPASSSSGRVAAGRHCVSMPATAVRWPASSTRWTVFLSRSSWPPAASMRSASRIWLPASGGRRACWEVAVQPAPNAMPACTPRSTGPISC